MVQGLGWSAGCHTAPSGTRCGTLLLNLCNKLAGSDVEHSADCEHRVDDWSFLTVREYDDVVSWKPVPRAAGSGAWGVRQTLLQSVVVTFYLNE